MEWGGEIAIWSHSHGEWARVVTRNRRGISKQPWGSAEHGTTRSECCQAAGLVLLFFFLYNSKPCRSMPRKQMGFL